MQTVLMVASHPNQSFPDLASDASQLEGTYRLFRNPQVKFAPMLKPHIDNTCKRAGKVKQIIVPHDTTEFIFSGEAPRPGLGMINRGTQGFLAHVSLAISSDGMRNPLGVLAVETISRTTRRGEKKGKADPERESLRWLRGVDNVEQALQGQASAIHVMDREADIYLLMSKMLQAGRRFVVRASWNRVVLAESGGKGYLFNALASQSPVVEREVSLSRRRPFPTPHERKAHPAREARLARLQFAAAAITIKRPPTDDKSLPPSMQIHAVHVWEVDTPEGLDPVEWWLYTNEPIGTPEEILAVVDIYRTRWIIEEFFKALKTGCQYEKRQFETYHALLNVLAVFIPIAWQMLALRHAERFAPDAPADAILNPTQIEVLSTLPPIKLGPKPTMRDALLTIALWGGFLKRNGKPGWLVLGRGFEKLLAAEVAWRAARNRQISSN